MITERERRESERLKTVEDYYAELEKIFSLAGDVEDDELDKIISVLMKNLKKKYKYIIRQSKRYQRRQNIFSVIRDKIQERKRKKELELEEEEFEDEKEDTVNEVEAEVLIENKKETKLIESSENGIQ